MCNSRLLATEIVFSVVLILSGAPPRAVGQVVVEIRPVQPEGLDAAPYPAGTSIDGNTINLPRGGTRVWLNVFVNWAPHEASVFQGNLDDAGLGSGPGAPLVLPVEGCATDPICEDAYGVGSTCDTSSGECFRVFYDCVRADSICALNTVITGTHQTNLILGWSPLPGFPGFVDPGFPVYTGTVVLEVPEGAVGTYTIGAKSAPASFFLSTEGEVPISAVTPAQIVVAEPATGYASIVPVDPLGTAADPYPAGTTIDGNTIYLPSGGTRVWFDVYIGGWAPILMETAQIFMDLTTFASVSGAPLTVPSLACGGDAFCEAEFGPSSTCDTDCGAAFLDASRSTLPPLITVQADQPVMYFAWTLLPGGAGVEDAGVPLLSGSFVLDVPPDAAGTYTLEILGNPDSFLVEDGGVAYSFADEFPGVVIIGGACCLPSGACMAQGPAECAAAGGTLVSTCLGDCNGNGRDDTCETWADCNGNGTPDSCEVDSGNESDCNRNGVLDSCEIAAGADDCDANHVLDECELSSHDCNGNGILDACETQGGQDDCNGNGIPDVCDLGAGVGVDCNNTGTLDACDIADGTSLDVDGNCIPDECNQNPAPLAEVGGLKKSRFVSFVPVDAGCSVAIRIKMVSLAPWGVGDKFASFEGLWRWVGPPTVYVDVTLQGERYNTLSLAQCDPHFMEWGPVGLVHVYGPEIMPDSVYEVQFFHGDCGDVNDPACFSPALTVPTAHWADVAPPFADDPVDPGYQPDSRDVAALVRKFVGHADPSKVVADLVPNLLNVDAPLDFRDISACVSVLRDRPYSLDGPAACP